MEFVWLPSANLGSSKFIFTHGIHNGYCYYDGFQYDDRDNTDDPVVSDPKLETFNADFKSDLILSYVYEMLDIYEG
jgi:hypothetical protein